MENQKLENWKMEILKWKIRKSEISFGKLENPKNYFIFENLENLKKIFFNFRKSKYKMPF
jgi:hypothetical protein